MRIFTSSTFTDMLMERNTLMEYVYPKIKEYCREKHGLEYQVVDMRWGVRDEMTDEHMTTVRKKWKLKGIGGAWMRCLHSNLHRRLFA